MTKKVVKVKDLKAGDYVVPARAVVKSVDVFGGLAIVDFTDNTATPPVPSNAAVAVERN